MVEILIGLIAILKADTTLTAIVPSKNILTGPVDILSQTNTQQGLVLPAIVLSTVAESQRARPTYTRDTMIQIDIWSKNNQLEVETIYERIINSLNYLSFNQGTASIQWQILHDGRDIMETDRRIWHKALTIQTWSYKPPGTVY